MLWKFVMSNYLCHFCAWQISRIQNHQDIVSSTEIFAIWNFNDFRIQNLQITIWEKNNTFSITMSKNQMPNVNERNVTRFECKISMSSWEVIFNSMHLEDFSDFKIVYPFKKVFYLFFRVRDHLWLGLSHCQHSNHMGRKTIV